MTKIISVIITVPFIFLLSSCSTYNSLVPSFATIGLSLEPEFTKTNANIAQMAELKSAYEKALILVSESNDTLRKAKLAYNKNIDNIAWWNPQSWF